MDSIQRSCYQQRQTRWRPGGLDGWVDSLIVCLCALQIVDNLAPCLCDLTVINVLGMDRRRRGREHMDRARVHLVLGARRIRLSAADTTKKHHQTRRKLLVYLPERGAIAQAFRHFHAFILFLVVFVFLLPPTSPPTSSRISFVHFV